MNHKQAAKLKVGDRIRFAPDYMDAVHATIVETNWCMCKFHWDDDDSKSTMHHRDMGDVERLEERYDVTEAVA